MALRPPTLKDLAQAAGFQSTESLAQAIEVHKTTITRAWSTPLWFENVDGRTLSKIMGVIPGANDVVNASVLATRRREVTEKLANEGLLLSDEAMDEALNDPEIKPQFLYTALTAARFIVAQDVGHTVHCLGALWGRPQTQALDVVFGTDPRYKVLIEPAKLAEAAESVLNIIITDFKSTKARAVAQAHLAHHIGKSGTGIEVPPTPTSKAGHKIKLRNAFLRRGATMGLIRAQEGNVDAVFEYGQAVENFSVRKEVELWALPSWSGDIDSRDEFALPRMTSLQKTAGEIIREVESYNDTYVLYLVTVYLPYALEEMDSQFGGQTSQLVRALEKKQENCELKELQEAAGALVRQLALA